MKKMIRKLYNAIMSAIATMFIVAFITMSAYIVLDVRAACNAPTMIDQWARCSVSSEVIHAEIQVNFIP